MAFVTQQQLERFRNEVFGHMNETVDNFRGLLTAAEQHFGGMTQRLELMDSYLDATFRDLDQMAELRMNLIQAVQLRAQEATNKVIIIDQDLEAMRNAGQDLRNGLDAKIAEIEQALMEHKDRGRNGDRGRSLMDPKNMTVSRFEGKKADFEKWRTEIENYLACFYKDIDKVLPYMRRCELPVNNRHLAQAIDQTEEVQFVDWDFKDVEDNGGKWIISKLGSDALYMSSSAGKGIWSIYAYLNQEYDELGVQPESLLQASFLSLVQNPAKTLAETKMRMVLFEGQGVPREDRP